MQAFRSCIFAARIACDSGPTCFAGERGVPHFNALARGNPPTDIAINDISLKPHSLAYISAAESIRVSSINQSINQHELAMAPHNQSSGAPEIQ